MDQAEYSALLNKAMADRNAAIAQAERDFNAKVEAVKLVFSMSGGVASPNGSGSSRKHGRMESSRDLMRMAIRNLSEFSTRSIHDWIQQNGREVPTSAISIYLYKLRNSNKITLVREGSGREGNTYRKAEEN